MSNKDTARIVRAENKLKKKIGSDVNIKELLRPEVIEQAQGVIDERRDEFVKLMTADLEVMERTYRDLVQDNDDTDSSVILFHKAESIRDRAGTFGYQLASQIAKSLAKYTHDINQVDEPVLVIVRKHIDGLQTVFRQNIEGAGGIIGVELMDGLHKLINKYHSDW